MWRNYTGRVGWRKLGMCENFTHKKSSCGTTENFPFRVLTAKGNSVSGDLALQFGEWMKNDSGKVL